MFDLTYFGKLECLLYSPKNRKIVSFWESKKLTIIDLDQKRVYFQANFGEFKKKDFLIFGEEENKIITVSENGTVELYFLNYSLKKVLCFNQVDIGLTEGLSTQEMCLAVCDKNHYVVVGGRGYKGCHTCLRNIVLKLTGNVLTKLAVADEIDSGLRDFKTNLHFGGYFGGHLLWVEFLKIQGSAMAKVYDYNVQKKELTELYGGWVDLQEQFFF